MTLPTPPGIINRLANQPIARTVAYYLILGAAVALLYQFYPTLPGVFTTASVPVPGADPSVLRDGTQALVIGEPLEVAWEVLVAMIGAYLLMLPVAWVYVFTRRKRGYQQSLVQTLIILPIVVAGVVILVKSSVALAFSLGGIVGAIAFRNRLEDTKDAVHIFLAIGVGLAAGVQVMTVAAILSIFYNLVNLILWWTDFGRVPAGLEGPVAKRRLQRLRQDARRTGAFVSQVDTMILKSMSPEQLEVLAERARKRQRNLAEQIGIAATGEAKVPRFDGRLRVVVAPNDVELVRKQVEGLLTEQSKRWVFDGPGPADGGRQALQFRVRLKKSIPAPLLVEAVRRATVGKAGAVDFS